MARHPSAAAPAFRHGCVASPHRLASAAGHAVLAGGGNAVDAAIACNLTLAVVMPYMCGVGGDVFALIWDGDDLHALAGAGRTPRAATLDAVRQAAGAELMPPFGAHAVTVPGAVDGWFRLLERFGTRDLGQLARPAIGHARDGFRLTHAAAQAIEAAGRRSRCDPSWHEIYGGSAGQLLNQPELARTLEVLADEGPAPFYRGRIAKAIIEHLRSHGGVMTLDDVAAHEGEWVEPLRARYRDVDVVELPPPTQGVTALQALRIVDGWEPLPPDGPERHHLLIEAVKLALSDRGRFVGDPDHMTIDEAELLADDRVTSHRDRIDPTRAGSPPPARPALGGTVYLTAADSDGMLVSLIQSNFMGFGSGLTVPGWGINLQNRAGWVSFDADSPDVVGPTRRPLHTLIPAMAFRDGRPWLSFGTMGGDSQAQIHLQLLARIVDDREDVQRAIRAPRWSVTPTDWTVRAEKRFAPAVLDGLRERGHRVEPLGPFADAVGHAHAIAVDARGYRGAADPRPDGAVVGW